MDDVDDGPDCLPGGVHQAHCRDAGKPVSAPRAATIIEVPAEDLAQLGLPVKVIKLKGEPPAFIFVMSDSAREALADRKFRSVAQTLGDMVHPSNATLIVLPDGQDLKAYELVVGE